MSIRAKIMLLIALVTIPPLAISALFWSTLASRVTFATSDIPWRALWNTQALKGLLIDGYRTLAADFNESARFSVINFTTALTSELRDYEPRLSASGCFADLPKVTQACLEAGQRFRERNPQVEGLAVFVNGRVIPLGDVPDGLRRHLRERFSTIMAGGGPPLLLHPVRYFDRSPGDEPDGRAERVVFVTSHSVSGPHQASVLALTSIKPFRQFLSPGPLRTVFATGDGRLIEASTLPAPADTPSRHLTSLLPDDAARGQVQKELTDVAAASLGHRGLVASQSVRANLASTDTVVAYGGIPGSSLVVATILTLDVLGTYILIDAVWKYAGVWIGLVFLGGGVGALLATGMTHKLRQLANAANEMAAGRTVEPLGIGGKDEVAQLAASFSNMADELQKSFANLDQTVRQLRLKTGELERLNEDLVRA